MGASGNTGSGQEFKICKSFAVEKSFFLSSCDSKMCEEKNSVFCSFQKEVNIFSLILESLIINQ